MEKQTLGILMLDTRFPRIPGDIGNPETFPFPIRKLRVEGASTKRVVVEGDQALLEPFLTGAKELEKAGVGAITTSCGFLAKFQKELAAQVRVPVFASSLLQSALAYSRLPEGKIVGILTSDARTLTEQHFRGVGIEAVPKVVYGLENTHFHHVFVGDNPDLDPQQAREDMVQAALRMTAEHPQVGAIVFECTNMPPYAYAVSQATGLPVYDITTLASYIMAGLQTTPAPWSIL